MKLRIDLDLGKGAPYVVACLALANLIRDLESKVRLGTDLGTVLDHQGQPIGTWSTFLSQPRKSRPR